MNTHSSRPKVVVIGAGIAGLTTAYRLQKRGIDVHLFEARSRIGGRVFSVEIEGRIAELGGQFINDGGKAENLSRLIQELGLDVIENTIVLDPLYFTGETFLPMQQLIRDKQFNQKTLKERLQQLAQRSANMQGVLDGLFRRDDPVYKACAVRLAAYEGASLEDLSSWYTDTLYHILLGGISAAHQAGEKEQLEIHRVQVNGGNALIAEKMGLYLADKLHVNMPLTKVAKGVAHAFELTFKDGSEVQADILVLAIPCTTYEHIVFDENLLPKSRLEAIKSVRYGTNAKIIVPCPDLPPKSCGFLNDRASCLFDGFSAQLTLYYTGEASKFSSETILDTYQYERVHLERGFKDCCPPMSRPVVAEDRAFSGYRGPVGHSWPNDPYAGGSYSYIAPGQESLLTATHKLRGEEVKTLFAPVDDTLYFAGEHTSILFDVPGTMEAACESGERIARLI